MPTVYGVKNKPVQKHAEKNSTGSRLRDMPHSRPHPVPSTHRPGGMEADRVSHSSKEQKVNLSHRSESRWNVQERTPPQRAPDKSMLEDDLQLSSDEEDSTEESTSWVSKGSRRARQSSSSSSASSSTSPSCDSASSSNSDCSTHRSRSPSPETHSKPGPASTSSPLNCSIEETEHPSSTRWHLDKWLKKDDRRHTSGSEELEAEPVSHLDLDSSHSSGGSQQRDHSPVTQPRDSCSPFSPPPSPGFNYSHRFSRAFSLSPSTSRSASPGSCRSLSPCSQATSSPCQSLNQSLSPNSQSPKGQPWGSPDSSPTIRPKPKSSPRPHSHLKSKVSSKPHYKSKSRHSPSPHSMSKSRLSPSPQTHSKSRLSSKSHSKPKSRFSPSPHSSAKSKHSPSPHTLSKDRPSPRPHSKSKSRLSDRPHAKSKSGSSPSCHSHSKSRPDSSPQSLSKDRLSPRPHNKSKAWLNDRPHAESKYGSSPSPHSQSKSRLSPNPHSKSKSRLSPKPHSKSKSRLSPNPHSKSKSRLSPKPHSKSKSKSDFSPHSQSKSSPSPRIHSKSKSRSSPSQYSKSKSRLSPQPHSKSRSSLSPKSQSKSSLNPRLLSKSKFRMSPRPQSKSESKINPKSHIKSESRPGPSPQTKSQAVPVPSGHKRPSSEERESEEEGQKRVLVSERKEDRNKTKELQRRRSIRESDDEEERKEKRRKEKGREKRSESVAVQPKQRPHTNSQRPQEESEKKSKKRMRKAEESKTCTADDNPSPPSSPSPKPVIPPTDSSSESDHESKPPPTVAKVLPDSTSSFTSRGQQKRAGRPALAQPSSDLPSRRDKEAPAQEQQKRNKYKLYTLVPFGRSRMSPFSQFARARGLKSLLVKIDLDLKPKEPVTTSISHEQSLSPLSPSPVKAQKRSTTRCPDSPESEKKKRRKSENGDLCRDSKRNHASTEPPPHRDTSSDSKPLERPPSEATFNGHKEADSGSDKRRRLPLTPLSDPVQHHKKGVAPQHSSRMREGSTPAQDKQTEVQRAHQKGLPQPLCESRGSPQRHDPCPKGTPPKRDVGHEVEHYLHEARRLKRRADATEDKFGKALNYVDAALSYMECGRVIEEGPGDAKSPYSMYAETVELIKYAMRLKTNGDSRVSQEEKQLSVLCFRCLALLHWWMFRLKKDHALRQSRALLDYFKTSPSSPLIPPPWSAWAKSTGALSPPSPSLGSSSVLINIPNHVHQMAVDHLDIMNSAIHSYEYWEVADNLAKENKEFFSYLSTRLGPLSLSSSMPHVVQYTRQALQWIRSSAHLS